MKHILFLIILALTLFCCNDKLDWIAKTKKKNVEKIVVSGSDITSGSTSQMMATVTPIDATDASITWTISDETIATISAEGLVTAKANGNVVVTATADDESGVTGTLPINISSLPFTVVSITPSIGLKGADTNVTIAGTNFSSSLTGNTVKFNGVTATVTKASGTALTVIAPKQAGTGPVVVTIGNNVAGYQPIFTYVDQWCSSPDVIVSNLKIDLMNVTTNNSVTFYDIDYTIDISNGGTSSISINNTIQASVTKGSTKVGAGGSTFTLPLPLAPGETFHYKHDANDGLLPNPLDINGVILDVSLNTPSGCHVNSPQSVVLKL